MEYRRLGSTGVKVSRLALGCGNFGGVGSAPAFYGMGETESQAAELLDHAFDAGINLLDTADAYGGGRSEQAIGRWLAARGPAVRDRVLVSSKVYNPVGPGPNQRGLSRVHIVRQIDASLARLRTDHIDLYLIHEPDPDTPIDETLRALDDAVRAGKILYVGLSNYAGWQIQKTVDLCELRLGRSGHAAAAVQPARPRDRVGDHPRVRGERARPVAVVAARRRLADRQVHARRAPQRRDAAGGGPGARRGGL